MPSPRFPRSFAWGVAASAPQIEGAVDQDGKGESIWDRFALTPGKVRNGDTLTVACDHYRRYRADFALMRKLGIKHYRLSLAWPRILPQGTGTPHQAGIDYYHRLFDALETNGITPWVTMFHWDLPQTLEDQGGWTGRGVVDAFGRYADTIVRAFGPRVKHWITVNEIPCFTEKAYGVGSNKAPGRTESAAVVNQAYHHALLCHGHGVRAVREHGQKRSLVGLAENPEPAVPVTETAADIAAARAAFATGNPRVLEPLYRGRYSEQYLRAAGRDRPKVAAGDFQLISLPTDYLGLNLYSGTFVRAGARGRPERLAFPPQYPVAASPWLQLMPQVMYWGPRFAAEVFGAKSIVITENGCSYDDALVNGECHDLHRREYLRACLTELRRSIADGAPVKGYLHWAFMDNFEWQDGYARRFGLCHVDFATQRRTPKLSAHYYSSVMRENRVL